MPSRAPWSCVAGGAGVAVAGLRRGVGRLGPRHRAPLDEELQAVGGVGVEGGGRDRGGRGQLDRRQRVGAGAGQVDGPGDGVPGQHPGGGDADPVPGTVRRPVRSARPRWRWWRWTTWWRCRRRRCPGRPWRRPRPGRSARAGPSWSCCAYDASGARDVGAGLLRPRLARRTVARGFTRAYIGACGATPVHQMC